MKQRRRTLCNRDCPDTCAIVATVEDGKVTRLSGDPDHPVTRGFLCYRTQHFLDRQYAADRLTQPLLRRPGQHRFEEISWDEALDLAAERLTAIRDESGPAAICQYRSGGSLGLLVALTDYFFHLFGPVTVKRGDICSGAGEQAQVLDFGVSDSNDLEDLVNARQIVLWGKNVFTSSPHTIPVLKEAARRGARLVLVDPVHHKTASLCERHLQLRPGGDFALAMAVARVLFAEGWTEPGIAGYCDRLDAFRSLVESRPLEAWCRDADVETADAVDLATRLGPGRPAAILVGWGMQRRVNGGAIVRALDALGAISGNLGVPGGGVSFYFRRRGAFRTGAYDAVNPPRTIPEPLLGPQLLELDDPPVRAMWISAANPVAMLPESETTRHALATREFVVVVDTHMTDTARLANLVLPTTTLLEADDLHGAYGHHCLGASMPVVAGPEGVRSDLSIVQSLAERVGLKDALAGSAREWKQRLLSPELVASGVRLEDLEGGVVRNPLAPKVLFEGRRFPTASGRVQLIDAAPPEPEPLDPVFPLTLLSISTPDAQSSQWTRPQRGPAVATVHPGGACGVADGDAGRLESRWGALEVVVRHDEKQRRDVVLIPKGGHLESGRCANALIRARLTDIGEGASLYDEPVRIVRT